MMADKSNLPDQRSFASTCASDVQSLLERISSLQREVAELRRALREAALPFPHRDIEAVKFDKMQCLESEAIRRLREIESSRGFRLLLHYYAAARTPGIGPIIRGLRRLAGHSFRFAIAAIALASASKSQAKAGAEQSNNAGFDFGGLSGTQPISERWGCDRGQPVDRAYIRRFLALHKNDIRGYVLEIGDNSYTLQFGEKRVAKSVIADVNVDNPKAAIIADLAEAPQIPDETFDCVILTQVLQYIVDVESALRTVWRTLKPGGVALITVPGISQANTEPSEFARWTWLFYPKGFRSLIEKSFDSRTLSIQSFGNVKTAISFLAGLAEEDLSSDDYRHDDPRYPVIIAVRVVKSDRRG